jgi:2-polyprenyl-6-methoxyphenol hydroxylase-like FAD-dependent oxidoreductase
MACELIRHGVPCRIVDQAAEPSLWSKAQVLHSRSLEVFEDMGVVAEMLERGKPIHGINMHTQDGKSLVHFEVGEPDTEFPHPLSLSQRETELILAGHLRRLGISIEREVKLTHFTQDDDGVTAELSHADGRTEQVRTNWLLGCDGAHSTARKGMGLELAGATYEWRITQADVRVDWPFPHADDEIIAFLSPGGPIGAFPLPGERRYRLVAFDATTEPTLENFQKLLDERGPKGAVVSDPRWMVQFTIHCRMVDSYRAGRAILAGDAAHIHSPAGGQGLNTGIQDAYNLAWKLGLVHRGIARPSILDSYEAERKPVAAAVLRGSDAATRGADVIQRLRSTVAQAVRNQILHFVGSLSLVQRRASRALSELDVGYPDSPLVGQHQSSVWSAHLTSDASSEAPALRDWLAFGDGPAPGGRVPDMHFALPGGGEQRLHALLRGGRHTLLLFDGAAPTESGYQNLTRIAQAVVERFGEGFQVHVIVPAAERPASLQWGGSVILDVEGALHRAFSARSECLYLVRPDGYVAFRSQPASEDALRGYLELHFV